MKEKRVTWTNGAVPYRARPGKVNGVVTQVFGVHTSLSQSMLDMLESALTLSKF